MYRVGFVFKWRKLCPWQPFFFFVGQMGGSSLLQAETCRKNAAYRTCLGVLAVKQTETLPWEAE